jgi:hypothetical protein
VRASVESKSDSSLSRIAHSSAPPTRSMAVTLSVAKSLGSVAGFQLTPSSDH